MGTVIEHRGIWHISNIRRNFGRDWAWAFIIPAGAPHQSLLCQSQKTHNLERNGHVTYLWTCQVNGPCPFWMKINCLRQFQLIWHPGLKSRQNILWTPQKHWKRFSEMLPWPTSYLCEAFWGVFSDVKKHSILKLEWLYYINCNYKQSKQFTWALCVNIQFTKY